jgi:plastocyanin
MNQRYRMLGLAATAVAAAGFLSLRPALAQQACACCGGAAVGFTQAATAVSGKTGQRATIVINGGYSPARINVKAGRPVQLTFIRNEQSGCGEVVQFPTLGLKRTLATGEKTVITFTPKKAGTISFTCGMGMYKGQVVAK